MWRIWWAPNNASRWQMWIKSAFKGLSWQKLSVDRSHVRFLVITEVIIRVFLYLILYVIRATILYTQMSPPTSCTMFWYTQLLHVSAMYLSHFQGPTNMVDVYSVYGNLSYIIDRLYIYIYICVCVCVRARVCVCVCVS